MDIDIDKGIPEFMQLQLFNYTIIVYSNLDCTPKTENNANTENTWSSDSVSLSITQL